MIYLLSDDKQNNLTLMNNSISSLNIGYGGIIFNLINKFKRLII